jgi:hypothetical protein
MSKELNLIEEFLTNGGPPKPETRATRHDLFKAVRVRDELLNSLRVVLLRTVAQQFVGNSEDRP